MIRIVSNGTALGTKVYAEDGSEIEGVMSIEVMPIRPNGIVTAKIELRAALDIAVEEFKELPLTADEQ